MHTLVTFMGRTRRLEQGYRRVRYDFPDGDRVEEIAFIGNGLAAHTQPDRLVVLGTTGSMWDQLHADFPDADLDETALLKLYEAVENQTVEEDQLEELGASLSRASGREVQLRLIPERPGMDETWDILETLAETTAGTRRLTLDITHGFRHLPMVALMTALYRRTLDTGMAVDGIWYAQLPPHGDEASMHDIRGLLSLADWNEAARKARGTGDLTAIARLLHESEPDLADCLESASFKEMVHQGQQARSDLRRARQMLKERELAGPAALFRPLLEEQTDWVDDSRLHLRQATHARNAVARGDYLRATLYGFEAYITRLVQEKGSRNVDPDDYDTREERRQQYQKSCRGRKAGDRCQAFKLLNGLRNVLAHGNKAGMAEVEAALQDSASLHRTLQQVLDTLLPPENA